jgi:hypothetical protein
MKNKIKIMGAVHGGGVTFSGEISRQDAQEIKKIACFVRKHDLYCATRFDCGTVRFYPGYKDDKQAVDLFAPGSTCTDEEDEFYCDETPDACENIYGLCMHITESEIYWTWRTSPYTREERETVIIPLTVLSRAFKMRTVVYT